VLEKYFHGDRDTETVTRLRSGDNPDRAQTSP
jgi:hypothetical protein